MRAGVSLFFQNYADYDRPGAVPDFQVFDEDVALGDLVEPLGFDALWTVEHHFAPYAMTDNPLQVLTYFAGRTERIDFGTMVVVLPWHDPVRVAEEIAVLDNFLRGRRLMLGFGRGATAGEFAGFRVDRDESRGRLEESLDIIRLALTRERFSYDGHHFHLDDIAVRPRPRTTDLSESMFSAWNSPETMDYAANSGLGQMFISLTSWDHAATQAVAFNDLRVAKGWEPIRPISVVFVYCAATEAEAAEDATTFLPNMMDASIRHYDLLANMGGEGARPGLLDAFTGINVVGTPEQCHDRFAAIQQRLDNAEFICVFKYGLMPAAKAEASMRLFAAEVLPALHEIPRDLTEVDAVRRRRGEPGGGLVELNQSRVERTTDAQP